MVAWHHPSHIDKGDLKTRCPFTNEGTVDTKAGFKMLAVSEIRSELGPSIDVKMSVVN